MDFFEAQALARRRTGRLVALFVMAVAGIVALAYAAVVAGMYHLELERSAGPEWLQEGPPGPVLWRPELLADVIIVVLGIVGIASLFKWMSFRRGGSTIAEMVGGRRIEPGRATPQERRLLNVVEEMSIAAGIPMPAVYVLDNESAINAFAAGLTTSDAVVAVSRGCLEKLSRDELQGVVGHEFSHILNGDMRLNVKLAAVVFGILALALIGRGLLRSLRFVRTGGKKGGGGVVAAIVLIGLTLIILGSIGWFFGALIQAAISRQREFLADASAVQFTRNPGGIGGALRKIGGWALRGHLQTSRASEIGHFFFVQAFKSDFAGLFATHPPLEERIRAVDPQWDGNFTEPRVQAQDEAGDGRFTAAVPPRIPLVPAPPAGSIPLAPAAALASIGTLQAGHIGQARGLLDSLPHRLLLAARLPEEAPALVLALLAGDSPGEIPASAAGVAPAELVGELAQPAATIRPDARLPLLGLALPVLASLPPEKQAALTGAAREMVVADGRITPFEFALGHMLRRHLGRAARPSVQAAAIHSFQPLAGEINLVLSVLAHAGADDGAKAQRAFNAGAAVLDLVAAGLSLVPVGSCGFDALEKALDRLDSAAPPIKNRLLLACATTVLHDGVVEVPEAEMLRAVADALDCPMPPVLRA